MANKAEQLTAFKLRSNSDVKGEAGSGHAALVVILMFAVYLEIPLYFTETFYVPGAILVFSIPALLLINRNLISKSDLIFVIEIGAILLLTAFYSPGTEFLEHKLSGVAQTTVAIVGGILLAKEIGRLRRVTAEKIFFCLTLALLIGTILEVLGVLSGVSDSFREVAYGRGGYSVYSNEERDLLLAGFSRPKLFTSEPSLLAVGFFVFSTSWLLLLTTMKRWLLFLAATMLMLYFTASPILLISAGISVFIKYLNQYRVKKTGWIGVIATLGIILVISFFVFSGDFLEKINSRFSNAASGALIYEISSENLRIVFPYLTAADVLSSSPIFGVGISGKDVVGLFSTLPIDPGHALGNNNLAALFIYMGLVGGLGFIYFFYRYSRLSLAPSHQLKLMILVLGFSQMMGGFESPRFWGYVFIFIEVLRLSQSTRPKTIELPR